MDVATIAARWRSRRCVVGGLLAGSLVSSMLGMSPSRGRGLGLSVRDPNQATPAAALRKREVLASKTPFRSTPRPPPGWADARVVFVSPERDGEAERVCERQRQGRLKFALGQWKGFRAARLRHVRLLVQVSSNLLLCNFLRLSL